MLGPFLNLLRAPQTKKDARHALQAKRLGAIDQISPRCGNKNGPGGPLCCQLCRL
jgi:hypothetical protein